MARVGLRTIPVCERCRRRKQRCESELLPTMPITECGSCRIANVECTFYDPVRRTEILRIYVRKLEERRESLLKRLYEKRGELRTDDTLDDERNGDSYPRYLGASSGIAFIRLAMNQAAAQGITLPTRKPTNDEHTLNSPRISSREITNALLPLPEPAIPPRPMMDRLMCTFSKAQSHGQIISRTEIEEHLDLVYGSISPKSIPSNSLLVLHILLAISILFIARNEGSTAAESLAETHFECAIKQLPDVLAEKSQASLQAMLLVLQFLLTNPQKPIVWYLLGHALRLAVALGLHKEDGINVTHLDSASLNERRCLFWRLYSMERAVGHTLGRPTGLEDIEIITPFPSLVSPEADNSKRRLANHRLAIRRLQSEVADILYQRTRPYYDGFLDSLQQRLEEWRVEALVMSGDDQDAREWFLHSYHNLTTFLHRPSPANPHPSSHDFQYCFQSSSAVVRIYEEMSSRKAIDCTWMAVHWLFLAAMTNLFCLWVDSNIRSTVNWFELNEEIHIVGIVLTSMAEKWHSARGCLDIYSPCALGTLRRYMGPTSENDATTAVLQASNVSDFETNPMHDIMMDEEGLQQYALFSGMQLDMFDGGDAPGTAYNFD